MSSKSRHPTLKVPVRVALLLMALRLALFLLSAEYPGQEETYVFLLLAALPALAIYAIWPRPSAEPRSVLVDTISALRITLTYSLLMIVFLYLYYTFADKNFFANFQDRAIAMELETNTDLTKEQITIRGREFFSKRNFIVLALGSFLIMSAFYSLLFSALKSVFLRVGKR